MLFAFPLFHTCEVKYLCTHTHTHTHTLTHTHTHTHWHSHTHTHCVSSESRVMGQQISSCRQCSPEQEPLLPLESFPDLVSLPPELAAQVSSPHTHTHTHQHTHTHTNTRMCRCCLIWMRLTCVWRRVSMRDGRDWQTSTHSGKSRPQNYTHISHAIIMNNSILHTLFIMMCVCVCSSML